MESSRLLGQRRLRSSLVNTVELELDFVLYAVFLFE